MVMVCGGGGMQGKKTKVAMLVVEMLNTEGLQPQLHITENYRIVYSGVPLSTIIQA